MTVSTNKPTRAQIARWRSISRIVKSKDASQPKGEVVPMAKKFVLQHLAPFDAMIGFTEVNRSFTKNDPSRPFTSLKGATFVAEGAEYTRTCMAYGEASVAIDKLLDAGETMLEVQLTPNFNTMKISGLVVDGVFVEFADDKPTSTGDVVESQDDAVPLAA